MDKIVTLELTVNEVNMVIAALVEQPFKVVNEVVNKIVKQGQEQTQAQPAVQNQND